MPAQVGANLRWDALGLLWNPVELGGTSRLRLASGFDIGPAACGADPLVPQPLEDYFGAKTGLTGGLNEAALKGVLPGMPRSGSLQEQAAVTMDAWMCAVLQHSVPIECT